MRHKVSVVAVLTALAALLLVQQPASAIDITVPEPAELEYVEPGVGGFMSPNIQYVATLPIESPGVSARVVQVGGVRRLYVSSADGLAVYNVNDPALPLLMGRLQIYNWENEDVAVSADGRWVLMSDFTASFYTVVVEVTDLPGGLVTLAVKGAETIGNHTIECVDDPCDWAYGSEGDTWDLRDKSAPSVANRWSSVTGRAGHHVTRDSTGLVWTDTTPIYALDVTDPTSPVIVARSDSAQMAAKRTSYQHNNLRPFAELYQPRLTDEDKADPNLRPGEILIGSGETYISGSCSDGSGPLATYDLRNFDQPGAAPFKPVDVFRPVNGDVQNGDAAASVMGCSAHWFDIGPGSTPEKIIVANAWYEHGTRIFEVDGKTAKIKQIGFFQPVAGAASASYWVGDEYIYTIDYERGIDILHYDKAGPEPTRAASRASWTAPITPSPIAARERYFCALAQGQNRKQASIASPAHVIRTYR